MNSSTSKGTSPSEGHWLLNLIGILFFGAVACGAIPVSAILNPPAAFFTQTNNAFL